MEVVPDVVADHFVQHFQVVPLGLQRPLVLVALRRLRPGLLVDLFILVHALLSLALGAYAAWAGARIVEDLLRGVPYGVGILERIGPSLAAGVLVPGAYLALPRLAGARWVGPRGILNEFSGIAGSVICGLLWLIPPGLAGILGVLGYWYGILVMTAGLEPEGFIEVTGGGMSPTMYLPLLMLLLPGSAALVAYETVADQEGVLSGLFGGLHVLTYSVFLVWVVIVAIGYGIPFVIGLGPGDVGGLLSEVGGVMFGIFGVPGAYLLMSRALSE